MIIEIHRPELEQLIHERMASGAFSNVEEVLLHALRPVEKAEPEAKEQAKSPLTGRALIEAMQRSPYKEIDLTPESIYPDISDALF